MMFPNKNKAATNKLIRNSLKANRARNRYVILAIILTTWLLSSVFSIGLSYVKSFEMQALKMVGTKAHAELLNPTADQLARLREAEEISDVGLEVPVAKWIPLAGPEDQKASLSWYDETEWERMKAPLLGSKTNGYPEGKHDIIAPTWLLDELGIKEPEVGMTIPLAYATYPEGSAEPVEHTSSFILSGWYTDYPHLAGREGKILIAESFAKEIEAGGTQTGSVASVIFKSSKDIDQTIERLETKLGLGDHQVLQRLGGNSDSGDAFSTTAGIAGIIAFVMFSGYLLIYNVLYVSVSTDTKQYGLLKTVGATQKQIKRIVRGQANRLAWIGIPIGLVIGAVTSFVVVPLALTVFDLETGAEVSFHPVIFAGAALFAWLTMMAGSRKPAKIASRISPIEASKYVRGSNKRGKGGAKPYRMAFRNLFRDKKRAATVFLSLFIGMTAFLTVNTLVLSMNTDNFVDTYVDNDFEIENLTVGFGYEGEPVQVITEEMIAKVRGLEGVTDVRATYVERAYIPYSAEVFGKYMDGLAARSGFERPSDEELSVNREGFSGFAVGLDARYAEDLNKESKTPIDVQRFEKGEIALVNTIDIEVGDKLTLGVPQGSAEREFEIGGGVPPQYQIPFSSFAPNVYLSKQGMEQWLGHEPTTYRLDIQADRKFHSQIQEQLESLISGERELKLSSKLEWMERMESAKMVLFVLGGAVSFILACIGILNFVSTMFTSIIVRRQEFAVMESIGMTRKQLRSLLLLEGTGYAAISLLLISTLGTLISYGAFKVFSQEADYAIYTFPTVPLSIAFVLILASCWLVPLIAYNKSKKLSIVERLKETS
ncbi:efflux ABC transporter permease [Paenibacillus sp. CCS19]|uniref:ABC transporter permease n=1 Tax=Paenibacillus sp. CCS19 TaxID=3158387 RepID=UPI002566C72F|nr:ABC transporter permease [Paenibacillus cellulosilyticus]GMK39759.1 efflux ABC transporter permease [Paenibacillus cellulosilyticus]